MNRHSTLTAPPIPAAALAGCVFCFNGQQVRVPPSAYTLDGFRAWAHSPDFPERGRISFLNREIVIDMSPEEITTHALVKSAVGNAVYNLNEKDELGVVLPDGVLLTNEEAGLSTEPDCSFISWERLEGKLARLVSQGQDPNRLSEVQGSPDWVLEVVSVSSVQKDTVNLPELYFRAGILEYWLIDARGAEVEMQILHRGPDEFVAAPRQGSWQLSEVFGRSFRLERRQGRQGLWQYTLRMKVARSKGR
jgi:Uma2 family endonuclease